MAEATREPSLFPVGRRSLSQSSPNTPSPKLQRPGAMVPPVPVMFINRLVLPQPRLASDCAARMRRSGMAVTGFPGLGPDPAIATGFDQLCLPLLDPH